MFKTLLTVAAAGAISVLAPAAAQAASTGPTPPPPTSSTTYVQAGRLLADPETGRVETNKTILVEDGRIRAILDGFQSGPGQIVDLRTSFVLPGLIDSHVHLTYPDPAQLRAAIFTQSSADKAILGASNARKMLFAGFTTVANTGSPEQDAINALRDGIAAGEVPGPRILAAGGVPVLGGHGDVHGYREDVNELFAKNSPGLCSGPDDCQRAVRQVVKNGADFIKIACSGGILDEARTGVNQTMTSEEIVAIVKMAHMLGRQVWCHAHSTESINAALRAGVDSIEHGTLMNEESIRLFKAGGANLTPTMAARDQDESRMSPAIRAKAAALRGQLGGDGLDQVRRAHVAGVKFAFGTDAPVIPFGTNAREFTYFVKAGFTPLEAVRAATTWGARHLQLTSEIGSISPGKTADIVAVRGDPLADITELQRVTFVMHAGIVYLQR